MGLHMSGVCEVHWFAELFGPHSSWDSCTWGPNQTIFLMSLRLPHTETHWQDFSPPLRGFSWVPILRVVRKAMPLLWGATCSRHLPQDLNERRCCRHVTGPHTRHTHTHTHTITANQNSRGSVSLTNTFSHSVIASVHLTHIQKCDWDTIKLSRRD